MNHLDNQLLTFLFENHKGQEKAITSAGLEKEFGVKSRDVQRAIQGMRRRGIPIGTSSTGYFYCVTDDEFDHLIKDFWSRISSMMQTVKILEKAKHANREQMVLW